MARVVARNDGGASSNAYAALRDAGEKRPVRQTIVNGEMVKRSNPLLDSLRAGRPVTVNLFTLPRAFRPDDISPSDAVNVYPDGRIELVLWRA